MSLEDCLHTLAPSSDTVLQCHTNEEPNRVGIHIIHNMQLAMVSF